MTPEAQRIAIAEACGMTNVHAVVVQNVSFQGDDRHCGITSDQGWVPDYLHDLNAMHEAEKVLSEKQRYEFVVKLCDVTKGSLSVLCFATAAQRAEAFLRCLGNWKD
jgi:hypothetical protein